MAGKRQLDLVLRGGRLAAPQRDPERGPRWIDSRSGQRSQLRQRRRAAFSRLSENSSAVADGAHNKAKAIGDRSSAFAAVGEGNTVTASGDDSSATALSGNDNTAIEVCVAMQSRLALKTLQRRTSGHSHAESSWGGRHPGSPDRPSKSVVASETCERRMEGGPRSSSFMGLLDQGDSLDRSSKGLAEWPEREVPDAVQVSSWSQRLPLCVRGITRYPNPRSANRPSGWGWTPPARLEPPAWELAR